MSNFSRVLGYSKPYWMYIVVAFVGSIGVALTDGAIGLLSGSVLKTLFSDGGSVTSGIKIGSYTLLSGETLKSIVSERYLTIFYILPVAMVALSAFRGACRFVQQYFTAVAGQFAILDIRNEVYSKNMGLSLRFFNSNPTGMLMAKVLNDVNMMQNGLSEAIMSIFRDSLTALVLLGVVFYLNWKLALITFVAIPLMIFPTRIIGRHLKRLAKLGMERVGDLANILQETFTGVKVVKAFGLQEREIGKFRDANLRFLGFARKTVKYEALHTPIMEVITYLGIGGVLLFGGSMVLAKGMSVNALLSFLVSMGMLYNPIRKLLNVYSVVQRSMGAAERVFEMIDQEPEITDPPCPVPLDRSRGEVELRNISFSYNEEPILDNVSLTARKGEVIALVGPSGAGKTTLVSLIPRFYDVDSGQITIDGIDIRSLKVADLLRQIALVDQETILFNETIANNIRYGKTDATDEEVERAARAAYAHDFIMEMPEGYRTNIGDRGVRLSGGQKQRICIARAILKDAPILILDEATSALDTESEQMVQQAINNLMSNRTTFVIAHRLSTILHADTIVVFEKGVVVERGSHQQLLEMDGLYKRLYDMQFKGEGTDVRGES